MDVLDLQLEVGSAVGRYAVTEALEMSPKQQGLRVRPEDCLNRAAVTNRQAPSAHYPP